MIFSQLNHPHLCSPIEWKNINNLHKYWSDFEENGKKIEKLSHEYIQLICIMGIPLGWEMAQINPMRVESFFSPFTQLYPGMFCQQQLFQSLGSIDTLFHGPSNGTFAKVEDTFCIWALRGWFVGTKWCGIMNSQWVSYFGTKCHVSGMESQSTTTGFLGIFFRKYKTYNTWI